MWALSILSFLLSALAVSQAATVCNGHAELCSRSYGAVTFIGAHNSYAVGSQVTMNQAKDVTGQLNDGVRTLQVQMHNATDGIHLCHSSCALQDSGLLSTYLTTVNTWLKANPNEVVTLVMVNSDNLPPSRISPAFTSAGLNTRAYTPPSASTSLSAWPTLGALIDAGTNLIVFMDYNADYTSVPWIIDEFSNMWEDAYDVTEQRFACGVNRTSGNSGSQLMMINHFLDTSGSIGNTKFFLPDKTKLNVTNSASGYGSIGYHVNNCNSIWGRNPNHILLDFYDSNSNAPFVLAASLNKVSSPTNSVTPATAATQTSAAGASSSGTGVALSTSRLSGADTRAELMSGKAVLGMAVGLVGVVLGAGRIM